MPDEVVMTSGEFVRPGFLAQDLHESMAATSPSVNAQAAHEALQIEQNCDYNQQLIDALQQSGEGSLPSVIRQLVRNNASDATVLPAMERFHLSDKDDALGSVSLSLQRITEAPIAPFEVWPERERPADFVATKSAPWSFQGGVLTFTRQAIVQIHLQFLLGLTIGGEAANNLQWRLPDSGTNRIITITPTLHLTGNLGSGDTMEIALPAVMFYPEHYARNTRIPVQASIPLEVKNPSGTYGRIDSLRVSLQRSTWIAKSTTGTYDAIALFKRTAAGTFDNTNFMEVTEL